MNFLILPCTPTKFEEKRERRKERREKLSAIIKLNCGCRNVSSCSLLKLRVSWIDLCHCHDWVTAKQYFITIDKNRCHAVMYYFILRNEGRKRKCVSQTLRAQVWESDYQDSNPSAAIDWICQLGLRKFSSPSLSPPRVRLHNNNPYLLTCGEIAKQINSWKLFAEFWVP